MTKNKIAKALLFLAITTCLYFGYRNIPSRYSGIVLRAQIVDMETLTPIAGVKIEAEWVAFKRKGFHGSDITRIHAVQVTTDANGYFEIPKWGPVTIPKQFIPASNYPHLSFKKPGYEDRLIGSYESGDRPFLLFAKNLGADWNGRKMGMYPLGSKLLRSVGFDPY